MMKELAFIKHSAGITLQYYDEVTLQNFIITYGVKASGKYALENVAGPWSSVDRNGSEDPKDWESVTLPGWDEEKRFLNDRAILYLTIFNATYGGGVEKADEFWGGARYDV